MNFVDSKEKDSILAEIKEELTDMKADDDDKIDEVNKQPEPKKKRFLGIGLSDSEDEEETGPLAELERYQMEKRLKSTDDPFLWWRRRRLEYPFMARLARKYLAVQGTSTAAERVMSRLGLVLTKRRQRMTGDLFSKIMFLSDCL